MQFNVSTLLQEPVGSRRLAALEDEPLSVPAERWERRATGTVQLLRTARGVLVQAKVTVEPELECARCLAGFRRAIDVSFAEEFVAPSDPVTGAPAEIDGDEFRITADHHLDVSEAVRQYEETALPLRAICREDCAGLCPQCGHDRNSGPCGCMPEAGGGPWAALAGLGDRLRSEEPRGVTEA